MVRNHASAASALRNRNRITNKTRLKILHGTVEADPILVQDEDEEKHRLTNLVAGVDAEDANEHHLQEVLTASQRTGHAHRTSAPPAAAYIPTPDSTGIVANYEELYPPQRWKDPISNIFSSRTVDESTTDGIADGFTYYMDERDKDWLDKNNEEARGEGTSAQGAMLPSGTRTSARSAKAKGKEPEGSQPVVVTEDEFELVMGVFEKVTHDRTEFLHHALENGMDFPAFAEYQEVFSNPLPASLFASHAVPKWVPQTSSLIKIAKAVYPHWRERRTERGGHPVIPSLNFDETDTLNECYVCFRRRETKAIRKTRTQQNSSSEKLARLQQELAFPLELAKQILARETLKKEAAVQSQAIWEQRMTFADFKRKFPTLNDKNDDELLIDKEVVVKKPETRLPGLKIKTGDATQRPEVLVRPQDRLNSIREKIDAALAKQTIIDTHWEDRVDNPYQTLPTLYACKLFKFVPPADAPAYPSSDASEVSPLSARNPRAARLRYGRGGRLYLDRRVAGARSIAKLPRSSLFGPAMEEDDDKMDIDEPVEDFQHRERLEARWKFDMDDAPPVGPEGADEQDRELVDDYDYKYMRHAMTLHTDQDHMLLVTDPTVVIQNAEGRNTGVIPYRLGMPPVQMRRDANGRPVPIYPPNHPLYAAAMANMNALMAQQKKMQPPVHMRISSNGGMKPPSTPPNATTPQQQAPQQGAIAAPQPASTPTPQPIPIPAAQPTPVNGVSRAAISMPHVDMQKAQDVMTSSAIVNGAATSQTPTPAATPAPPTKTEVKVEPVANRVPTTAAVPAGASRPQAQLTPHQQLQQQQILQQLAAMPAYTMSHPLMGGQAAYTGYPHHQQFVAAAAHAVATGALSQQQVQTIKSAFASVPGGADITASLGAARTITGYVPVMANSGQSGQAAVMNGLNGTNSMAAMTLPNAANLNLKLPAARQWQAALAPQNVNGTASAHQPVQPGANGNPTSATPLSVRNQPPGVAAARMGMRNGVQVSMSPSPLPIQSQASPPRVNPTIQQPNSQAAF